MADPELVAGTLEKMGQAGAAISILMTTISALATAVVVQYRQGNKVYGYRLAERDTMNKALTDSSAAINAFTKEAEERNRVIEELADSLGKQASALNHLIELLKMHHDAMKDEVKDQTKTIGSLADAIRVNTGMVTDARNAATEAKNAVLAQAGRRSR